MAPDSLLARICVQSPSRDEGSMEPRQIGLKEEGLEEIIQEFCLKYLIKLGSGVDKVKPKEGFKSYL